MCRQTLVAVVASFGLTAVAHGGAPRTENFAAGVTRSILKTPLRFEPNVGQFPGTANQIQWTARGPNYIFLFTKDSTVLRLHDRAVRISFSGSRSNAQYTAENPSAAETHYVLPRFQGGVQTYSRLRQTAVYPGIDVVYYGNGEQLEYDFEVARGADPDRIRLRFDGADKVSLNRAGDLQIQLGREQIVQHVPVAYDVTASGKKIPVRAKYRAAKDGTYQIAVNGHRRWRKLVIDPTIVYAQYLFGSAFDNAVAVTHDASGFIYIAGNTQSTDFYIQGDYYSLGNGGSFDAWIMKVNPNAPAGLTVPFTTYYGGTANETVKAIATDGTGKVYITGTTTSANLPTSSGAFQTTNKGGTDAFIAVFDTTAATGTGAQLASSLIYASYIGGGQSDDARGIAAVNGKAYITGSTISSDFPTVKAIQPTPLAGYEMFVSEFDITQTGAASLVVSTYIDAFSNDYPRTIAVDPAGLVYIAGVTYSPNIPVTANAYQPAYTASGDGFLLKLDLTNAAVVYGTYLGGSGIDEVKRIVIESPTRVALTGYTLSADFPITQSAYQAQLSGYSNAFVSVLDLTQAGPAALVYSTYFGGTPSANSLVADVAYDLSMDGGGRYYIGGYTLSTTLPVTNNALNPNPDPASATNGFVAILDRTLGLNGLLYSSYITGPGTQIVYGVDALPNGQMYIVGSSTADIFPPGQAFHATNPGNTDGFVLGLQFPSTELPQPPPGDTSGQPAPPAPDESTPAVSAADTATDPNAAASGNSSSAAPQ